MSGRSWWMAVACAALVPAQAWGLSVVVDGSAAEWSARGAAVENAGIVARDAAGRGEYVWRDAAGDERTDLSPGGDPGLDITRVQITGAQLGAERGFAILVRTAAAPPAGAQLQVAVDTDRVAGSGGNWLAGFADTRVAEAARWEFLIQTRFATGSPAAVLTSSFAQVGTVPAAVGASGVELFVPWSAIDKAGAPAAPVRFTFAMFRSAAASPDTASIGDSTISNAIDVVSDYGDPAASGHPNTWAEVSDQTVDYFADVSFRPAGASDEGEVYAPLVVDRFVFDSFSSGSSGEWFAVRNASPVALALGGFKVGDAAVPDSVEAMLALPAVSLAPGAAFVVATDAAAFFTRFGVKPNAEIAGTDAAVPDVAAFAPWASARSFGLADGGDELAVVDPSNAVVDVAAYGSGTYPGGVAIQVGGTTADVVVVRRAGRDTDDCSADFAPMGASCTSPSACGGCGTCVQFACAPVTDGTVCDDSDACTLGDRCQGGVCGAASRVTCEALDDCHDAGVCQPATGVCTNPAKGDGSGCNDGNACTQADSCSAGVCRGGTPVVCTATDTCHEAGQCDPQTGLCSTPVLVDGSACSDGDPCTENDTCRAGSCIAGSPMKCAASNDCHDARCVAGACRETKKQDGIGCNDANACTRVDTCQAGQCVGSNPVECVAQGECKNIQGCNPATGKCEYEAKPDGVLCDDHDPCTQNDKCSKGICEGGGDVQCPPPDACHERAVCDHADGSCDYAPRPDGTACDDADPCTVDDSCRAGTCVGAPKVCVAVNDCHQASSCDATGECTSVPKPNGTRCDDGNACTQVDTCRAGECVGEEPVQCAPLGVCYLPGTCDRNTGTCVPVMKENFSDCGDGDICHDGVCEELREANSAGCTCATSSVDPAGSLLLFGLLAAFGALRRRR